MIGGAWVRVEGLRGESGFPPPPIIYQSRNLGVILYGVAFSHAHSTCRVYLCFARAIFDECFFDEHVLICSLRGAPFALRRVSSVSQSVNGWLRLRR